MSEAIRDQGRDAIEEANRVACSVELRLGRDQASNVDRAEGHKVRKVEVEHSRRFVRLLANLLHQVVQLDLVVVTWLILERTKQVRHHQQWLAHAAVRRIGKKRVTTCLAIEHHRRHGSAQVAVAPRVGDAAVGTRREGIDDGLDVAW